MVQVTHSVTLQASVDDVWGVISGFNDLPNWHPVIERSELAGEGVGAVRTLTLAGGGEVVERLTEETGNSYSYIIVTSPLPVANYKSTISVEASGDGCKVNWEGNFDADGVDDAEAAEIVSGVYMGGLTSLQETFGT